MLVLYDLEQILNKCKDELYDLGFLEIKNKNYIIQINSRFRNKLGRCSYNKITYIYTISINESFMNICPDKVKNTMMHELIHSINGCMNHGTKFQNIAKLVNNKFGYNVHTTSYYEDYDKYIDSTKNYKYKIKCSHCGEEWFYEKTGKVIRSLQNNPTSCTCPHCKTKRFSVINL